MARIRSASGAVVGSGFLVGASSAEDIAFSASVELLVLSSNRLLVLALPRPDAAVLRICELRQDLTRQEWLEYAPGLQRVAPCG